MGKFCKFCYDCGEDEKVYTSHYVKDQPGPNGRVVCPKILARDARRAAYARSQNKRSERVTRRPAPKMYIKKRAAPVMVTQNRFAGFSDSDEEESPKRITVLRATPPAYDDDAPLGTYIGAWADHMGC